jgi:hypothetical protein
VKLSVDGLGEVSLRVEHVKIGLGVQLWYNDNGGTGTPVLFIPPFFNVSRAGGN